MSDTTRMLEVIEDPAFLEAKEAHRAKARHEQKKAFNFALTIATASIVMVVIVTGMLVVPAGSAGDVPLVARLAFDLCLLTVAALLTVLFWFAEDRLWRLYVHFYDWSSEPQHHFCPGCRFHLPSTIPWACPRCAHVNSGDNDHSYFGWCGNCEESVDAILCQRCKRAIRLRSDVPVLSIAVIAGRHPSPVSED